MADHDSADRLKGVYEAKDRDELSQRYDDWAGAYDRDVLGFGYKNPALAVGMMGRHVGVDEAPILDAGAGTGMMGELLSVMGYRDLIALDMSEGMLAVAEAKGVYDGLETGVLGEPLSFETDRFAATLAIGVLTVGHAPPTALDELVRVTRPSGHIIASITAPAWDEAGFKEKVRALENAGLLAPVETSAPYKVLPGAPDESSLESRIHVYRVL